MFANQAVYIESMRVAYDEAELALMAALNVQTSDVSAVSVGVYSQHRAALEAAILRLSVFLRGDGGRVQGTPGTLTGKLEVYNPGTTEPPPVGNGYLVKLLDSPASTPVNLPRVL